MIPTDAELRQAADAALAKVTASEPTVTIAEAEYVALRRAVRAASGLVTHLPACRLTDAAWAACSRLESSVVDAEAYSSRPLCLGSSPAFSAE